MKLQEKLIECVLRDVVGNSAQFGFIPGRSSMEPIYALRQKTEKYTEAQRGFVSCVYWLREGIRTKPLKIMERFAKQESFGRLHYIEM